MDRQVRIYFIICGKRTGSTMLARILDSHTQVFCPSEFAIPSLLGRKHWKYARAVEKAKTLADAYGLSASSLMSSPWRIGVRRGMIRFTNAVLSEQKQKLFVVKEPAHVEVVDRIIRLFGRESLLLLSRGPLATASSLNDTFHDKTPFKTWSRAHSTIAALAREGCFLLKYEQLVCDPAASMRRVCMFLDVPYQHEMLHFGKSEHVDDRLDIWSSQKAGQKLVPIGESELHKTVAKGVIDTEHNRRRIKCLPPALVESYLEDAFDARSIAQELGYDELAEIRSPLCQHE